MTMDILPLPDGGGGGGGTFSLTTPQRTVMASGNIVLADRLVICQHAAPISLALPNAAGQDFFVIIKDFSGVATSFPITLTTSGGDTIDPTVGGGAPGTAYTIGVDYSSVFVACNGAGRYMII